MVGKEESDDNNNKEDSEDDPHCSSWNFLIVAMSCLSYRASP